MLNLVKPKHFIPIHGELRQLKRHAILAQQLGIPQENIAVVTNGQTIEFNDGQMRLGEKVPTSYVLVDGSGVGDVGPDVMREREMLGRDGVVMVNLLLDDTSGHLVSEPEILTRGFIVAKEASDLFTSLRKRITDRVATSNGNMAKDVEQTTRDYIYSETHRQPMVFVMMNRI